jgi:serine/threonine-protein kinase
MNGESIYREGRVIKNRYRLDEFLGEGPICKVYRGYDQLLAREVALKLLHPHLAADPETRSQFLAAAHRTARIQHPNLVEIYDFGLERQIPFLAEELVKGVPLSRRLAEGRKMTLQGFLDFAYLLTDTIDHLHRCGGVHGNLHSENIILLPHKRIKVLDAGLPHLPPGGEEIKFSLPKQDFRAEDIKSLGMIFYHCLMGKELPPALLKSELATPALDLGPEIPPKVSQILEKALSRGERTRFSSAGEILKELRIARLRENLPSTPLPEGEKEESFQVKRKPFSQFSRAQKIAFLSIASLLVIFLLIWILVSPVLRPSVEVPNLVGKDSEEARKELELRGLKLEIIKSEYRADFSQDRIISQSPAAGNRIREGGKVAVVVSLGPLKVPNVSGLSLDDAKVLIRQRGLTLGNITYSITSEYPPGTVIESDPPYGREVSQGEPVDLLVSKQP